VSRPSKIDKELQKLQAVSLVSLKEELRQVRHKSLLATRQGDFMCVARMTASAAQLNKSIADLEGIILDAAMLVPPAD
jgi:hypothetical protein